MSGHIASRDYASASERKMQVVYLSVKTSGLGYNILVSARFEIDSKYDRKKTDR